MTDPDRFVAACSARLSHETPGTMRVCAAVIERQDAPFVLQDMTLGAPRPDEVLVRMVATGICATDAHVRQQRIPAPLPAILGHEGAGIVVGVGTSITHLKPGDHVVLSYHSCGQCKPCLSGHAAYCDKLWEANFAGARLDGSVGVHRRGAGGLHAHFFGQSSFATYALAHRRNAIKVPRDVPLEMLGPLGCGLQTGAGAILKAMKVPVGASVAVFGVGAVGLAAVVSSVVFEARREERPRGQCVRSPPDREHLQPSRVSHHDQVPARR